MHAEQNPADPDDQNDRCYHHHEHGSPPAASRRQEHQQKRSVTNHRPERVPARETAAGAMRDRVRQNGPKAAYQRLQYRIQHQRTRPSHQQVQRNPPPPADGQQDHGQADDNAQHRGAAQHRHRVQGRDQRPVTRNHVVQVNSGGAVSRFQRSPAQPDEDQQEREYRRGDGNCRQRRKTPVVQSAK